MEKAAAIGLFATGVSRLDTANRPLWLLFGNYPTYRLIFAITRGRFAEGISNLSLAFSIQWNCYLKIFFYALYDLGILKIDSNSQRVVPHTGKKELRFYRCFLTR